MTAEAYPRIETDRLLLCLPPQAKARQFVEFYETNRARLQRWDPARSDAFYTESFWRRQLQLNRRDLAEDRAARFTIYEKARPDRVAGVANFSNFVRGCFQACHLGYTLDGECEGRGLMFEALQGALDFVFEELRLHRVMANYQPTNARSGNLLRRLGFQPEGYARDYLLIDGEWRDHVLTSLVRPKPAAEASERPREEATVTPAAPPRDPSRSSAPPVHDEDETTIVQGFLP